MTKIELRAVLKAYRQTIEVASPWLHPDMENRSAGWATATETELELEIERFLLRASVPSCSVRLFFKMGEGLVYAGCNEQFAADAGLSCARDLIGLDDFDPRVSWVAQAAKYRRDDRAVVESGRPKLGIIERQSSASGVIWLETSKVPICETGTPVGVFGAYRVIDAKTASRRSLGRPL